MLQIEGVTGPVLPEGTIVKCITVFAHGQKLQQIRPLAPIASACVSFLCPDNHSLLSDIDLYCRYFSAFERFVDDGGYDYLLEPVNSHEGFHQKLAPGHHAITINQSVLLSQLLRDLIHADVDEVILHCCRRDAGGGRAEDQ
ncbi:Uncharacterised protein [BD1-7 clade bacterium]|uniref:Uncharacterized protein n=1 Tax=BD1-7 clade bacterium TaxID=2029982 RepID=A0A5S9MWV7_9GAMM|nr:Uncharacterised protein [BD1-7 clade bacterium]CAA0083819.1 Uncharacterised protein [BD1-7 clade bacterium]